MRFINCTPHAITVWEDTDAVDGGRPITLYPSGILPRVETIRTLCPNVAGVRIARQTFGQVQDMPEPAPFMAYIVSGVVLSALAGTRSDCYAPDTGPDAIREKGQIVAVRGLVK